MSIPYTLMLFFGLQGGCEGGLRGGEILEWQTLNWSVVLTSDEERLGCGAWRDENFKNVPPCLSGRRRSCGEYGDRIGMRSA